jgi:hypothetical protein
MASFRRLLDAAKGKKKEHHHEQHHHHHKHHPHPPDGKMSRKVFAHYMVYLTRTNAHLNHCSNTHPRWA